MLIEKRYKIIKKNLKKLFIFSGGVIMSKEFPITISSWTLGDQCKFKDRVKAAKEAGYEGIGLRAETYVDALNEGLFDKDILAILDKYDMKVTEVEYIVQWAEEHRSYEQKYKEQLCFHMCELFNVKQINCGLMENYSVEYTAQKLRELCQRAGKYIIGVEPMPYSGIPDVKKGWAVVKAADCENAKLILDTWHWVRANQPVDISVLADEILSRIPDSGKYIDVKVNGSNIQIPFRKIIYAEHFSHMIHIHTVGERELVTRQSFDSFITSLKMDSRFYQCNRGVVINLEHAVDFDGTGFRLDNGSNVSVSRKLLKNARQTFMEFLFQRRS